jgi:hypothetical protein
VYDSLIPFLLYPLQNPPHLPSAQPQPPTGFYLLQMASLDFVQYLQPLSLSLAQLDSLLSHRPSWTL